jgi:hypothetical protein
MRWNFYNAETGLLHGRTFSSTDASVIDANTPAGCVAIEGDFDPLSQRFDLELGKIVDYQPARPSSDHEWNATARRWQLSAKAAQDEADDAIARDAIARLEQSQLRSMREALLGDAQAKTRIADIDQQIVKLRVKLRK